MEAEFLILQPEIPAEGDALVSCAVRLRAPAEVNRTPAHFILLVDISESMMQDQKLENVKKCVNMILDFLTEEDRVSIVTFGEESKVVFRREVVNPAQKAHLQKMVSGLVVDGCTNLSAGLASVREILDGETMKTGLLLLTDGHANRGVSNPTAIRAMTTSLRTGFENLSIHVVGYGTDHNADLLRSISEDVQGSYNVVSSISETAFAFADILGGLMSCVAQNVTLEFPLLSVFHGSTKFSIKSGKSYATLGDVYAGTKPIVLVDIPADELRAGFVAKITGTLVPSMTPLLITQSSIMTEPDLEIRILRLRYDCTALLSDLPKYKALDAAKKAALEVRIENFGKAVAAEEFNGNTVVENLREEAKILQEMLQNAKTGGVTAADEVVMSQHASYFGLGRGFSSQTPRRPARPPTTPGAPLRRAGARGHLMHPLTPAQIATLNPMDEDPEVEEDEAGIPPPMASPVSAAFQNNVQRRLAATLSATVSSQH